MKSKKIIEHFIIIIAVFINFPAYGMENNTISISMTEIDSAYYHDGYLFLEFNKNIWLRMREFTTKELHQKITLKIGDSFVVQPHVGNPLDSRCQLLMNETEANNFLKNYNDTHHTHVTNSNNDRIQFLKTWMKSHPLDMRAFSDVIELYHEANNVPACENAINYYETYSEQSVKDHLFSESYFLLTDCYAKSNHKDKALSFLLSSIDKIHPNNKSRAYEYIGDLYRKLENKSNAIEYYKKALESLEELRDALKAEYSSMNLKGFDKIIDLLKKDKERIKSKIFSIEN